jgi:tetratricopeptide (TPR) repeat protein
MGRANPKAVGAVAGYGLVALSVWLGFEIIKVPLALRGPPELAVRLAPQSPQVLGRLAESELAQGRVANAKALADDALTRAPFNVQALRVRGLAEAREGSEARADEIVTLAGNWSLRDTEAHSWLVQTRLQQGQYISAFAHADTLIRRRPQLYPQVFALFSTAASTDTRSMPALVRQLETSPPWRSAYLLNLVQADNVTQLQADLAVALQPSQAPLSNTELGWFYTDWLKEGRLAVLPIVRARLERPAATTIVQNADFEADAAETITPFDWTLTGSAGLTPEVLDDDLGQNNMALRVGFDGYGEGVGVAQTILLSPGRYELTGRSRRETEIGAANVRWTVDCIGGGPVASYMVSEGPAGDWIPFSQTFDVDAACSVAQLRLVPIRSDRRSIAAIWFDDMAIDRQTP